MHFRTGSVSVGIEAREAVAGKQRPVDLLLAILPAAPPRDRRQEGFDVLAFELLAHDLFVPRPGPDGEPIRRREASRLGSAVKAGGDKPEVLHQVDFGDRILATPALSGDRLYLRTAKKLWAFGPQGGAALKAER